MLNSVQLKIVAPKHCVLQPNVPEHRVLTVSAVPTSTLLSVNMHEQ